LRPYLVSAPAATSGTPYKPLILFAILAGTQSLTNPSAPPNSLVTGKTQRNSQNLASTAIFGAQLARKFMGLQPSFLRKEQGTTFEEQEDCHENRESYCQIPDSVFGTYAF
jgi:hypothetical protein